LALSNMVGIFRGLFSSSEPGSIYDEKGLVPLMLFELSTKFSLCLGVRFNRLYLLFSYRNCLDFRRVASVLAAQDLVRSR